MTKNKLYECTLVSGNHKGKIFLFKNRDKSFIVDFKIIHEINNGVEVVYSTDQAGWVEGINEFGMGFVYSFLTVKDNSSSEYDVNWWVTNTPHTKPKKGEEKGNKFLDVLISKTLDEAIDKISKYMYNGNYFLGTKEKLYEIEIFKGQVEVKELNLKPKENIIKTNHGILIPYSGDQETGKNIKRASSEIRKIEAERAVMGFKNYTDLIKRMGQQTYDKFSTLNIFRTDDIERTVSQVLLDLNLKTLHFIHLDENCTFFGIEDNLPKDYEPKLKIIIRNKKEFHDNEWERFNLMRKELYKFDTSMYNFQ